MATAAPSPDLPLFYSALQPLNSSQHAKHEDPADRTRADHGQGPCGAGDRRRVSAAPALLPDRVLGRRRPDSARADGPGTKAPTCFSRRWNAGRAQHLHPGLYAALPVPARAAGSPTATSCRCASTRIPARSATSRTASRCSTTTSRPTRPRRSSSSASSSRPPGSAPAASCASQGIRPADGRRGRNPARRRAAAVHLPRLQDGRRVKAARASRRRVEEDEPGTACSRWSTRICSRCRRSARSFRGRCSRARTDPLTAARFRRSVSGPRRAELNGHAAPTLSDCPAAGALPLRRSLGCTYGCVSA